MNPSAQPPDAAGESASIFTAGFSTQPLERFLDTLRAYGVQVLVDVRSRPFSRHAPHFNRERVEQAARAAGLDYLFLGRELGGMPEDPAFYDAEGHVLYDRIAAQPEFRQGLLVVLEGLLAGRRMALCCAEGDPRGCHRRLLVGRVLREGGVGVTHILPGGGLMAEAELLDEERAEPRQLSLFGSDGERVWRSLKPVKK